MRRLVLLLALPACLTAPFDAGVQDGRRGNERVGALDLAGAETAYVAGLARNDVPTGIQARLWHNLAIVRARTDRLAEADSAFARALELAAEPSNRARIARNAGTAHLVGGVPEAAVPYLRRALLLRPTDADARRNLELALRRIETPPEPPEPSDFAQRLKAQADALIDDRKYRDALDLMTDGRARDATVAAFDDFIQRLDGVVQIEDAIPSTP